MSKKLLIVDDDLILQGLFRRIFQESDYEVVFASDGERALSSVQKEKPDLVILDLMLPALDGYHVCARLHDSELTRQIPILMLSANGLPESKVAGFNLGADDYVTKPFDVSELRARVEVLLERTQDKIVEEAVSLSSGTFLFTDLKGSSHLYERAGDARAFEVVSTHFRLLEQVVAEYGGRVLKTMGDGVMAVFSSTSRAVEAAIQIQRRTTEPFRELAGSAPVNLKVSVHQGTAVALQGPRGLDYFGNAVNVAAVMLRESLGSDIVLSESSYEDPEAQEILRRYPMHCELVTAYFKGLPEARKLWRLSVK